MGIRSRIATALVLLLGSPGCGGGTEGDVANDAGTDTGVASDAGQDSGPGPLQDAGVDSDGGRVPECRDCGPGLGFAQPTIRGAIVAECYCAWRTYRQDFYDALALCLDAGCDEVDVDVCYQEALTSVDATPIAREVIDLCEGDQCGYQDCRFLAGFEDAVLEDYLDCFQTTDCGWVVDCVDFDTGWCEVF